MDCVFPTRNYYSWHTDRDSGIASSRNHTPRIEILGYAWDFVAHAKIRVLLVPAPALPEWSASYLEAAREGILGWRSCIAQSVQRYGFSYLPTLDFEVFTQGVNASELSDVTDIWISHFNTPRDLATTTVTSDRSGGVRKATIVQALVATGGPSSYILTEEDTQAIIAEEFGHVLGLGHADSPDDLMSGFDKLPARIDCHSTLDIYGLTVVYDYLRTFVFHAPARHFVSLDGTNIAYMLVNE